MSNKLKINTRNLNLSIPPGTNIRLEIDKGLGVDPVQFVGSPSISIPFSTPPLTVALTSIFPTNNSTDDLLLPNLHLLASVNRPTDLYCLPTSTATVRRYSDDTVVANLTTSLGSRLSECLRNVRWFLSPNTRYYLDIPANSFADADNNSLVVSNKNAWNFTTGPQFSAMFGLPATNFSFQNASSTGLVGLPTLISRDNQSTTMTMSFSPSDSVLSASSINSSATLSNIPNTFNSSYASAGRIFNVSANRWLLSTNSQLMETFDGGTSWQTNAHTAINAVIFANGQYVRANNSGDIQTSVDKVTWTTRYDSNNSLFDINFSNGVFVAVGRNAVGADVPLILRSTDGIVWNSVNFDRSLKYLQNIGTQSLIRVLVNGNKFCAISNQGNVLTSDDAGLTWKSNTLNYTNINTINENIFRLPYASNGSIMLYIDTNGNLIRIDGDSQRTIAPFAVDTAWNGTFFFVSFSNGSILRTTNGQDWLNGTPPTAAGTSSPKFLINGTGLYSYDDQNTLSLSLYNTVSQTFDTVPFNRSEIMTKIIMRNDILYGIRGTSIFRSTDGGQTWTQVFQQTSSLSDFTDIVWANANGRFLASIESGGRFFTSTDGTTWSFTSIASLPGSISEIVEGPSTTITVLSRNTSTSWRASTWNGTYTANQTNVRSIFTQGALTSSNTLLYDSNARASDLKFVLVLKHPRATIANEGFRYMALTRIDQNPSSPGNDGRLDSGKLFRSSDGENWIETLSIVGLGVFSVSPSSDGWVATTGVAGLFGNTWYLDLTVTSPTWNNVGQINSQTAALGGVGKIVNVSGQPRFYQPAHVRGGNLQIHSYDPGSFTTTPTTVSPGFTTTIRDEFCYRSQIITNSSTNQYLGIVALNNSSRSDSVMLGKRLTGSTTVTSNFVQNSDGSRVVCGIGSNIELRQSATVSSPGSSTWSLSVNRNTLHSITWTNGQLVAVGAIGTILTSSDATAWTIRPSGTTQPLRGVAGHAAQIVAVGDNGTILSSPNGITWTSRTSGTTNALRGVTWSGTQFVAVGVGGTIRTSPDGITWTSRTSGITNSINTVIWSGTQFVAVGSNGSIITSPDGITWTRRNGGTTEELITITWSGSQFFAFAASGTHTVSSDGVNWEWRSPTPQNVQSVTWTGTQFVTVGTGATPGSPPVVLTSPNGVTWTLRNATGVRSLRSVTWTGTQLVAVGDDGAISVSTNGIAWSEGSASAITNNLSGVAWSGSQFVAVADFGIVLTSTDGIVWTARQTDFGDNLRAVTSSGTQFVAVGDSGRILTSSNGISWTVRTSGISTVLRGATWSGTQFVVVGDSGRILTSPDGITWTSRTSGTSNTLWGISSSGTQFVVVGDGGIIRTSPDGITWTSRTSGTTNALRGVTWSGTQFVVVGDNGTILSSTDGITWSSRTSGTTNSINAVAWSGNQFVAVGNSGIILSSTSTEYFLNVISTSSLNTLGTITSVFCTPDDVFFAVNSNGSILRSADGGTTWTIARSRPTSLRGFSYSYNIDNSNFIAQVHTVSNFVEACNGVISGTTASVLSLDTITQMRVARRNNGNTIVLAGDGGRVYVSRSLGYSWRDISTSATANLDTMVIGDNSCVISNSVSNPSTNITLYNRDSFSSPLVQVPERSAVMAIDTNQSTMYFGTNANLLDEVTSAGIYLRYRFEIPRLRSVGFQGSTYHLTTNSLHRSNNNGTKSQLLFSLTNPRGIETNGTSLLVATNTGIQRTTNGTTWSSITLPSNVGIYSLNYNGSVYSAVTTTSKIYTSTDGITWTENNYNLGTDAFAIANNGNAIYVFNATRFGIFNSGTFVTRPVANASYTLMPTRDVDNVGDNILMIGVSGNQVATSTNFGNNLSNSTIGGFSSLESIANVNNNFVLVADTNRYAVSNNMVNWNNAGTALTQSRLLWAGSKYMEVSPNGRRISLDLTNFASYLGDCKCHSTYGSLDLYGFVNGEILSLSGSTVTRGNITNISSVNDLHAFGSTALACMQNGSIYSSTNGIDWTLRNSQTEVLYEFASSSNIVVAVGNNGTILTSPDGVTWTARTSGTTQNLNSVAWNGTLFIAVGNNGTILTSPDGVTWTARTSGTTQNLNSVTAVPTQTVVVANGGVVLATTDTVTWVSVAFPVTANLIKITDNTSGIRRYAIFAQDGLVYTSNANTISAWALAGANTWFAQSTDTSSTPIDIVFVRNNQTCVIRTPSDNANIEVYSIENTPTSGQPVVDGEIQFTGTPEQINGSIRSLSLALNPAVTGNITITYSAPASLSGNISSVSQVLERI